MSELKHQPILACYDYSRNDNNPNTKVLQVGPVRIWYSYRTVVAFKVGGLPIVVHQNVWSKTTGRHLGLIDDGDRKNRVDAETFERLWDQQVAPILASAWGEAEKKAELLLKFEHGKRQLERDLEGVL